MPGKTENGSGESTPSGSSNSSENGAPDRPLREIIYLDLDKISSYLSQLNDGLREYRERIKNESKEDSARGRGLKVGEGVVPLGFNVNSGNTNKLDATTMIERKRDHHAALMFLEKDLEQREVVGVIESGKLFVRHSGNPFIVDYLFWPSVLTR